MFRNKNWLKVLVPELVMVFVALAVFFGCRWLSMEDKEAAAAAVVAVFAAFAAEEYKLPMFWVFVSYLMEAAIIFFSIYLSFSV